jgi:anti-sigma regulatory factor (Ser/Thr protein kinase)
MDRPVLEDEERLLLPRGPASIAEARRFVSEAIADPEMREIAQLLTSELTTNAVRHGAGEFFEVRVRLDGTVRVEVIDESTEVPKRAEPSSRQAGGRGLLLVESFATDWGFEVRPSGKTVWFELGAPGESGRQRH